MRIALGAFLDILPHKRVYASLYMYYKRGMILRAALGTLTIILETKC